MLKPPISLLPQGNFEQTLRLQTVRCTKRWLPRMHARITQSVTHKEQESYSPVSGLLAVDDMLPTVLNYSNGYHTPADLCKSLLSYMHGVH